MFQLSSSPLDVIKMKETLRFPEAGAFAAFEGWVRSCNNGKKVAALEYEALDKLCEKEGQRIIEEAKEKFTVIDVQCVHRIGRLDPGEMAVWVAAAAVHRDDAFKACRFVIDEIKSRLPIWKKEFYENGDSAWAGCPSAKAHA